MLAADREAYTDAKVGKFDCHDVWPRRSLSDMNDSERVRLAGIVARRSEVRQGVDTGWETQRCNAIGSLWGRDASTAVEIVGIESWVLRAETSR